MAATVTQIEVPDQARTLSVLHPADYEDAFFVRSEGRATRSAVDWARAVLEQAPERLRRDVGNAWSALGLNLAPPATVDGVLGWHLRRQGPEVVVLAASSPLGIRAELVFATRPEGLLYGTFVRLNGDRAQRTWALVQPSHPPVVRELLELAASSEGDSSD